MCVAFPLQHNKACHCLQQILWQPDGVCVVMIEIIFPAQIFAQCVCWELFHLITPSASAIGFLLSSTYFLYFLVFVMISWIRNTVVRVLLYSVDPNPLQFSEIIHYLYISCGASTRTIYGLWMLWSMDFKMLEKHNFFLFLMHLYSSISDAESGKAYGRRGASVPCVCWHMYQQTSSQANVISRPHTLPMTVWYDFHWHHLFRTRWIKCCSDAENSSIMSRPISNVPLLHLPPSHWWRRVLVLVADIFFNILSIFIQSPAFISPQAIHFSLRLPCHESWMWLATNDVALKICSSYSELKELMQILIFSWIRQFRVSDKLIPWSKFKI